MELIRVLAVVLLKKAVFLSESALRPQPVQGLLATRRPFIGAHDLAALHHALSLREQAAVSRVAAITAGGSEADVILCQAYALGADEVFRVPWEGDAGLTDASPVGRVLAGVLAGLPAGVVFCGHLSPDSGRGLVPYVVAQSLGWPLVTRAVKVQMTPDLPHLRIHRDVGRGNREVVECPLPAVVTAVRYPSGWRYPKCARLLAFRRRNVPTLSPPSSPGMPSEKRWLADMEMTRARPRPKKIFTPDENLSAAERMKMIVSGGLKAKKGKVVDGSGADAASKVYEVLVECGYAPK